jgi:hypothetical protein
MIKEIELDKIRTEDSSLGPAFNLCMQTMHEYLLSMATA